MVSLLKLVPPISREVRFLQFLSIRSVFVIFVKLLKPSDRKVRDFKLAILGESCPCKLLPDIRSAASLLQEYMLSGIVPVKLLYRRSKFFRLSRLEKLTLESTPLKWLLLRSTVMRFVQLLRADGSSPDIMLWSRCNSSNFLSWPIESGILPLKLFPPRFRLARFLSLIICAPSSFPSKLLSGSERYSSREASKSSLGRAPLRLL
uniref:Uncharacterized protein n=1 Tax=Triticum urartu TaxID=4572 RepID=A0A8R7USM8_TRIUA